MSADRPSRPARLLKQAFREPEATILSTICRIRPELVMSRHAAKAKRAGLVRGHLLLSFDCDTPADAPAAERIHEELAARGARSTFAVPGELIERDADTCRRLAAAGCEFLNHGYREHTFYDEAGAYTGGLFYDRFTRDEVVDDIRRGDAAIREVLDLSPSGFRTPHFGTFQRADDLKFLHHVLGGLGYAFSSSTTPIWGFKHGPAFRRFGLLELPVSGRPSAPLELLDSWGCFAAPDRVLGPMDYEAEGVGLARALEEQSQGVINVYVDPAHVIGQPAFIVALEAWLEIARPSTFEEFVALVR
jgi:hypothetical protein